MTQASESKPVPIVVPIVNYNPLVQVEKKKDDKKEDEEQKEGKAFKK